MHRGECTGVNAQGGCRGRDGLHPARLFPRALPAPDAVPSHIQRGKSASGWQSSAIQRQSSCQACATAPSDTARPAPAPFHQPWQLSSQGKLPLTQLGDFRAVGETEQVGMNPPFPGDPGRARAACPAPAALGSPATCFPLHSDKVPAQQEQFVWGFFVEEAQAEVEG